MGEETKSLAHPSTWAVAIALIPIKLLRLYSYELSDFESFSRGFQEMNARSPLSAQKMLLAKRRFRCWLFVTLPGLGFISGKCTELTWAVRGVFSWRDSVS